MLSRCQTVLAHAFSKGVTRSAHQSAQPRPLPVRSPRAAEIPSTRSLLCARETSTAQHACVTCLRAGRWVCSKRAHAHNHASRYGARNHSTSALDPGCSHVARGPRRTSLSHYKGSRTLVGHPSPSAVLSSSRMSPSALARVKHLPLKRSPTTTGKICSLKVEWSLPVFCDCDTQHPRCLRVGLL